MSGLPEILSALTTLSQAELTTVLATSQSLLTSARPTTSRSKTRKSGGTKGKKGPAQRVSPYDGEPSYKAFKAAEKALKLFLKERKASLKDYPDVEGANNPAPVASFYEARRCWFRVKAELNPKTKASLPEDPEKTVTSPGEVSRDDEQRLL